MVKIRLARFGTKKRPTYRIVAINSANKRDGIFLDEVGKYFPQQEGKNWSFNTEKVKMWLDKGAIVTHTVYMLLKKEGITVPKKQVKKK